MRFGAIILFVIFGFLVWQTWLGPNAGNGRANWPAQFQSNGERIYFTATSASGSAISGRGGGMGMGMMSGGGCVNCHGVERQGSRLVPRFWVVVPPLTADALFGDHEEDGHGDHEEYTDDTLRLAISRGIDAGGESLDPAMPRWSMTEQDMDDLIGYLKTENSL